MIGPGGRRSCSRVREEIAAEVVGLVTSAICLVGTNVWQRATLSRTMEIREYSHNKPPKTAKAAPYTVLHHRGLPQARRPILKASLDPAAPANSQPVAFTKHKHYKLPKATG